MGIYNEKKEVKDKFKPVLDKLKHEFMEDVKEHDGVSCPCCGQLAKIYKRKLSCAGALGLIRLYKLGDGFHHIDKLGISKSGGSFAQLRHWGLIEQQDNDDESKRSSGKWAITNFGKKFVDGLLHIESHVVLYNNKLLEVTGDSVTIKDVLGNKFNYKELMEA